MFLVLLSFFLGVSLTFAAWPGISRIESYHGWPHKNKQIFSPLPFDQHFFIINNSVHEWSFVENRLLERNFSAVDLSPIPGMFPNVPIDSCLVWNDRFYCFFHDKTYGRFSDDLTVSVSPVSPNGWPGLPEIMDTFLALTQTYSVAFAGDQFTIYHNGLDSAPSGTWPKKTSEIFPDFPSAVTHDNPADEYFFHPYIGSLVMFHNGFEYHFDWMNFKLLQGYPRPLSAGSTTCSGSHDLSSFIGWVSDRRDLSSPATYAPGQDCQFRVFAPFQLLRTAGPYNGIWIKFFDFGLGSGDYVEIWEENDAIEDEEIRSNEMMYFAEEYVRVAPISFPEDITSTLIHTFSGSNMPTLASDDAINSFYVFSNRSRSITIKFHSDSNPATVGSGFRLLYGMVGREDVALDSDKKNGVTNPLPAHAVNHYIEKANVAVMNSIFTASTQSMVFSPPFGKSTSRIHALFTPYTAEAAASFSLAITYKSCTTGNFSTVVVPGTQIYMERNNQSSVIAYKARSALISCGHAVNYTLIATEDVAVSLSASYFASAHCSGLTRLSNPKGIVEDGSGLYSDYGNGQKCSWLITPNSSDPDVLFVTARVLWYRSNDNTDTLKFYDSNTTSNLLATYAGIYSNSKLSPTSVNINNAELPRKSPATSLPYNFPLLSSSDKSMFVFFETTSTMAGEGWTFEYELINRPSYSSLVVNWDGCFTHAKSSPLPSTKYPDAIDGTLVAGQNLQITFSSTDKNGRRSLLELRHWFRQYVRFVPSSFPENIKQLLFGFPGKLSEAKRFPSVWEERGVTADMLDLVYELESFNGESIVDVAPLRAGYYDTTFGLLVESIIDWPTALNASNPEHVTDYENYFLVKLHPIYYPAVKHMVVIPDYAYTGNTKISSVGEALYNSSMIAGSSRTFNLELHDVYGNLLDHGGYDIRVFAVSMTKGILAFIDVNIKDFHNGTCSVSFTPTVAANFQFTVLVKGFDVPRSPFMLIVSPVPLTVVSQTVIEAEFMMNGRKARTAVLSKLPTRIPITFIVSLRDQYGNVRTDSQDTLNVMFDGRVLNKQQRVINGTIAFTYTFADYHIGAFEFAFSGGQSFPSPTIVAGQVGLLEFEKNEPLFVASVVLSVLGGAQVLVSFWFVIRYRNDVRIKAASPNFLLLICFGCLLEYCVVPLLAVYPLSDSICNAVPFLGHGGFMICFGALFVKTYRVMKIFNRKSLHVISLNDKQLGVRFLAVLAAVLAYLLIWTFVSPPELAEFSETVDGGKFIRIGQACASEKSVFPNLALILEAVGLAYGAFLASQVRKTPDQFNEAPKIAFCIHELLLIGGILILLDRFVLIDQETIMILETLSVWGLTTITLSALFGPWIYTVAILGKSAAVQNLQDQVAQNRSRLEMSSLEDDSGSARANTTATTIKAVGYMFPQGANTRPSAHNFPGAANNGVRVSPAPKKNSVTQFGNSKTIEMIPLPPSSTSTNAALREQIAHLQQQLASVEQKLQQKGSPNHSTENSETPVKDALDFPSPPLITSSRSSRSSPFKSVVAMNINEVVDDDTDNN